MRKIIFIQNIITSYRIDLFNEMYFQTKKKAIEFEVFYFRESYSGRYLPFDKSNIKYPFEVFKGFYCRIKSIRLHLNSSLVWRICCFDSTVKVVLGVSWNDINIIIIAVLKRLGLVSCDLLLWSEANYMTKGARKKSVFKKYIRDFVFNSFDKGVIIPGEIAKKTVYEKWGLNNKLYFLPNLLKGDYYQGQKKSSLGALLNIVTVARLEEIDKGILNFIERAGKAALARVNWVIAGDGPDKDKILFRVKELGLNDHITLLGNLPKSEIRSLYNKSDLFLLPSLSDPNPLTVIEALHAGLPLMLSKRCGNVYEAVQKGVNGTYFDPMDALGIKESLAFFEDKKRSKSISELSEASRRIAKKNFDLIKGVSSFLNQMDLVD